MPSAILAIRRYPTTLLLAMLLFLATLALTAGSLGTVGSGGGDDGDGGSGIGGTGKSGEFGGSGFGGTGGPSPFFTSVDADDGRQSEAEPTAPADSSPVTLRTDVAVVLEQNALVEETQQVIAGTAAAPAEPLPVDQQVGEAAVQLAEAPVLIATPPVRVEIPEDVPVVSPPAGVVNASPAADIAVAAPEFAELSATDTTEPVSEPEAVPAQTMTVAHEAEEEGAQDTIDRSSIPERIQRPDLPPFQRIRPVERPSLLPSRVQPMRI